MIRVALIREVTIISSRSSTLRQMNMIFYTLYNMYLVSTCTPRQASFRTVHAVHCKSNSKANLLFNQKRLAIEQNKIDYTQTSLTNLLPNNYSNNLETNFGHSLIHHLNITLLAILVIP